MFYLLFYLASRNLYRKDVGSLLEKHFFPSNHMLEQALDLSDNGEQKDTAQMVLKKAEQIYESDHVHINLTKGPS